MFSIAGDPLCIFDYQATGDEEIATDTAKANSNFEEETKILG